MAKVDIQAVRGTIVAEMKRQGLSRRGLSDKSGIGESAIRDLLTRTDNPGIATLGKVAGGLGVPLDALINRGQVPLIGKIGAGGEIAYQAEDDEYEMVARPPNALGEIAAFEVVGDSMLPKYEAGDIIYTRVDQQTTADRHVGEYCAIRLIDGGTYLKMLAQGSSADRYTLRSLNAGDLADQEVLWATPVLFIMPRASR